MEHFGLGTRWLSFCHLLTSAKETVQVAKVIIRIAIKILIYASC